MLYGIEYDDSNGDSSYKCKIIYNKVLSKIDLLKGKDLDNSIKFYLECNELETYKNVQNDSK